MTESADLLQKRTFDVVISALLSKNIHPQKSGTFYLMITYNEWRELTQKIGALQIFSALPFKVTAATS